MKPEQTENTISKYEGLSGKSEEEFKRLTGVHRSTFRLMSEQLALADAAKKARGGPKSSLSIEDRLLMALEYLREYRTYFHIGESYRMSESNTYKICRWVEETLVADPRFALPGKRALVDGDAGREVVLLDATETPVQRPKKNRVGPIPGKRNNTQ